MCINFFVGVTEGIVAPCNFKGDYSSYILKDIDDVAYGALESVLTLQINEKWTNRHLFDTFWRIYISHYQILFT